MKVGKVQLYCRVSTDCGNAGGGFVLRFLWIRLKKQSHDVYRLEFLANLI